jgi:hypothetical protein
MLTVGSIQPGAPILGVVRARVPCASMQDRDTRVPYLRSTLLALTLAVSIVPLACDTEKNDKPAAEADAKADAPAKEGDASKGGAAKTDPKTDPRTNTLAQVEKTVGDAVDQAVEEAGAEHLFDPEDKTIRKRACEFLTADMVAKAFEVPAGELKQHKMMGCMYTRRSGDQLTDAKLMMIRVHKTTEGATRWFGNATASKTKEQLDAEMELVKEKLKEREELDTSAKKKTAVNIADMLKDTSPDAGIRYEDVPGIGDQARVSDSDGALWVRLGNMTFQVQAYQGPDQPKPDSDPKNPRGMAKAAIEAQKKWLAETLEERKAAAVKLAPPVLEALASK